MVGRRLFNSRKCVVTLLGSVLAIIFVSGVYTINWLIDMQRIEYREKQARLAQVEHDISVAKAKIKVLETQKEHMQTSVGVEDAAREKLGMVRKGEVVYVVNGADEKKEAKEVKDPVCSEPEPGRSPGIIFRLFGALLF